MRHRRDAIIETGINSLNGGQSVGISNEHSCLAISKSGNTLGHIFTPTIIRFVGIGKRSIEAQRLCPGIDGHTIRPGYRLIEGKRFVVASNHRRFLLEHYGQQDVASSIDIARCPRADSCHLYLGRVAGSRLGQDLGVGYDVVPCYRSLVELLLAKKRFVVD